MSYNQSNCGSYKSCCACKKTKCICKVSCYTTCKKVICCPPPCPPPSLPSFRICPRWNVKKLISNQQGVASNLDTTLINAWGILYFDDKIWVSSNGYASVFIYNSSGVKQSPVIAVDSVNAVPELPSGLARNQTSECVIASGVIYNPATVLIATENGGVDGWENAVDSGNTVIVINEETIRVFKGIAMGASSNLRAIQVNTENFLYLADFSQNEVALYDANHFAVIPGNTNAFKDTSANPVPDDFAPFNVTNINNLLYVLYAKQSPSDAGEDLPGCGNGYINIFRTNGEFVRRFATQGPLNSPWGMIKAPCFFGLPENSFIVSNHGDGAFLAYSQDGIFLGRLQDPCGREIFIDGLWGLAEGPDNIVYFSAGPNEGVNGLVGSLTPFELKIPFYPNGLYSTCPPVISYPPGLPTKECCRGFDYGNNCPTDCGVKPRCGNTGIPLCGPSAGPHQKH